MMILDSDSETKQASENWDSTEFWGDPTKMVVFNQPRPNMPYFDQKLFWHQKLETMFFDNQKDLTNEAENVHPATWEHGHVFNWALQPNSSKGCLISTKAWFIFPSFGSWNRHPDFDFMGTKRNTSQKERKSYRSSESPNFFPEKKKRTTAIPPESS